MIMSIWYEESTDDEIKEHYGLDPHEVLPTR
nr:MAG TPA: hypothetical protein [Herelleviridae sp.]